MATNPQRVVEQEMLDLIARSLNLAEDTLHTVEDARPSLDVTRGWRIHEILTEQYEALPGAR